MLFIKPADLREIVTFPLFSDLVQSDCAYVYISLLVTCFQLSVENFDIIFLKHLKGGVDHLFFTIVDDHCYIFIIPKDKTS